MNIHFVFQIKYLYLHILTDENYIRYNKIRKKRYCEMFDFLTLI